MGRLATRIVNLLKKGYKITLINCKNIIISGRKKRNINIYKRKFNIKTRTNPNKGPFHLVSPSNLFRKTIRGMISYKIKKNYHLFQNLSCFDTIPSKYLNYRINNFRDLKSNRVLKPDSRCTYLKEVSEKFGWNCHNEKNDEYKALILNNIKFKRKNVLESYNKTLLNLY